MERGYLPKDKELYRGRRIMDNEWTYGMAVLPIDERRSFIVHRVEENTFVDGAPCMCWYDTVIPSTVEQVKK